MNKIIKHIEYISRLEFINNGIDLSIYKNIEKIKIIDPIHKDTILNHTEIYFKCVKKDLICVIIYES